MTYRDVGLNAQDAVAAQQRELALLAAKEKATEAGAKVVEEAGRVYLRRAITQYLTDRENQGSMEAKEQAELVGNEFMLECGKTFLDEITREDIFRFHKALRNRGCAPRTIANKHNRLKSILLFSGLSRNVIPTAPKYEKALPTIYTSEQIGAIRQAAQSLAIKKDSTKGYMSILVDLILKCGLREQEAEFLSWDDIFWTDKVLRVRGKQEWGFQVKDCEQRDIPIPDDLLAALKAFREMRSNSKLILGTGKTEDKPNGHLLRDLKRLAKKSHLNCDACKGCKSKAGECEAWTLHKFRRTYGTTLLRNGIDLRTVQRFMGHSDMESTMRYLRPASGEAAQAAVNAIQWS